MTDTTTRNGARPAGWGRLTPLARRRILLGSLMAVAVTARDVVLLLFAAGFFAVSEFTPSPRALPAPA